MEAKKEKEYCGCGWKKDFDNGGYVISCSAKKDLLMQYPVDDYGNIRFCVASTIKELKGNANATIYKDTFVRAAQGTNKPQGQTLYEMKGDDTGF